MKYPWKRRRRRRRQRWRPTLRFTPTAWAKLLYLRDLGPTEVGGFGISAPDDPLLVEEFFLLPQRSTAMTVQFADEAVADYFDQQVDRGLAPERFGRIWIHTHPGNSAVPSSVDEETFQWSFLEPDWAVMAIVARGGATYARLRFNTGPGTQVRLGMGIDYRQPFPAADHPAWREEYDRCVSEDRLLAVDAFAMGSDPQRAHPVELLAAAFAADLRGSELERKEVRHPLGT